MHVPKCVRSNTLFIVMHGYSASKVIMVYSAFKALVDREDVWQLFKQPPLNRLVESATASRFYSESICR